MVGYFRFGSTGWAARFIHLFNVAMRDGFRPVDQFIRFRLETPAPAARLRLFLNWVRGLLRFQFARAPDLLSERGLGSRN
jgi:hypothetical protein